MKKNSSPYKSTKVSNDNLVNEPSAEYGAGMGLTFFNSFEEMEEHDAKELSALSPLQHLKNATALIKKVFAKELKTEMKDMKLFFKKDGYSAS